MVYIRVKKIKGKSYAYLVENKWTAKGPRQKVKEYLGKLVTFPIKKNISFEKYITKPLSEYQLTVPAKTFLKDVVAYELEKHGFTRKKQTLEQKGFVVDLTNLTVEKNGKKAVFGLNEGFLCDATLKKVINFRPKKNKLDEEIGHDLAKRLVHAGLQPEHNIFIALFGRLMNDPVTKHNGSST